jgi:predicted lipid-binding transport protein (Tim44 family)
MWKAATHGIREGNARMNMTAMGRVGALTLALAAVLTFMIEAADARVGRGGSVGSRGTRTYTTPPSTQTAPTAVKPVEKSITQPGTQTGVAAAAKPAATAAPAASRFGGGFGGLLLGGLLGAGLFGLLSGAGLFGGMTGFASFLGLLLQGALIAGVVYLVMAYFRGRQQPAHAYGQAGAGPGTDPMARSALNGGLGGARASAAQAALTIGPVDFDAFERLLSEIQAAYSREDAEALGEMVTPEMLSYFSRDIADYKRKGVRNEVTDVKLLQGDLAESWREDGTDYATVAMRFSLRDGLVDRNTGQPVSGGTVEPEEATEVWTFRRDHNQPAQGWQQGWELSAIQQTA